MRVVLQRVTQAGVKVDDDTKGAIDQGLVIFLGIEGDDNQEDADWLIKKITQMRIFGDESGKMNLNIKDVRGSLLIISQFTLHAKYKKGNRPSFIRAAKPDFANDLYQYFIASCKKVLMTKVEEGVFGVNMDISLVNDGPVTLFLDTKNKE